MNSTLVIIAAAAAAVSACSRGPAPLAPDRIVAAGDTGQFGSGPVAMTSDGRHIVMELKEGSNAWFFNISNEGWADLIDRRPLPAGRTEVALPRSLLYAGRNVTRTGTSRTRLLRREALLIVVWPRGVEPAPTFNTNHQLVDEIQPQFEVPEVMFDGRRTSWASWLLPR